MLTRKELSNRIARCQREVASLTADNDRGQNDNRIALLSQKRIETVRQLDATKRGA